MKSNKTRPERTSDIVVMFSITKALALWMMLIAGIALLTRQVRSTDTDVRVSSR